MITHSQFAQYQRSVCEQMAAPRRMGIGGMWKVMCCTSGPPHCEEPYEPVGARVMVRHFSTSPDPLDGDDGLLELAVPSQARQQAQGSKEVDGTSVSPHSKVCGDSEQPGSRPCQGCSWVGLVGVAFLVVFLASFAYTVSSAGSSRASEQPPQGGLGQGSLRAEAVGAVWRMASATEGAASAAATVLSDAAEAGSDAVGHAAGGLQWPSGRLSTTAPRKTEGTSRVALVEPRKEPPHAEKAELWEVIHGGAVAVRGAAASGAKVLGTKASGAVVLCRPVAGGKWVALLREHGFIRVFDGQQQLLQKSKVSFMVLSTGTCSQRGLVPVTDQGTCEAAAVALRLADTAATLSFHEPAPEGCYVFNEGLWLSENPANQGRGAVAAASPKAHADDLRRPVCMSQTDVRGAPALSAAGAVVPGPERLAAEAQELGLPAELAPDRGTASTSLMTQKVVLFCFCVLHTSQNAHALLKAQVKLGAGIFDCEGHAAFAREAQSLGRGPSGAEEVTEAMEVPEGDGKAAPEVGLGTRALLRAWERVRAAGLSRRYDWAVKVEPETVLLPGRLRNMLLPHMLEGTYGSAMYVPNCDKINGPGWPMMLGGLELASWAALELVISDRGSARCSHELSMDTVPEDYFFTECLSMLGATPVADGGALSDARCRGVHCGDGQAAFHPFRTVHGWLACWQEATQQGVRVPRI